MTLNLVILGNSIYQWLLSLAVLLAVFLTLRSIQRLAFERLDNLNQKISSLVVQSLRTILEHTHLVFLLALAFFFAIHYVQTPLRTYEIVSNVLGFVFFIQVGIWASAIARIFIEQYLRGKDDGAINSALGLITFITRIFIWSVVVLLILENAGVDITALVAGLGVGGIAIALAVQNILSDLLSSLSIVLDKPFEVGDFVVIGDLSGNVEQVGIKTTRIRSLSGEQVIVSNSDLLSSRIRNYKRMQERRIVFTIGVTYQTPNAQLKDIPAIIEAIIAAESDVRFGRSHLKEFGSFSINFESVYYVLKPDYAEFMSVQQNINLALHAKLEQAGIEFAYPTQTLFIEKGASNS